LTILHGLELELDNMMTSIVRRRRFAPTPTPSRYTTIDSLPLLACLPLLGVVGQITRHCPNFGFVSSQATLFADADFIASRSFSTALAFSSQAP
jgi:hypothetical protein